MCALLVDVLGFRMTRRTSGPFVAAISLAQQPETVALTNVTVVPMDSNRVLNDQTVIVSKDRITAVARHTDHPASAIVQL